MNPANFLHKEMPYFPVIGMLESKYYVFFDILTFHDKIILKECKNFFYLSASLP